MKKFKSCFTLVLALVLVLVGSLPAFAASSGGYGFYVPTTNSKTLWSSNYGTTNKEQTTKMEGTSIYISSKGQYGYFSDTIYVKPGNISLSMSVAQSTNMGYDTNISSANNWRFNTLSGSCSATVSSYKYNLSSMFPGTWWKVNINGMKAGEVVQISTNYLTGKIVCVDPAN